MAGDKYNIDDILSEVGASRRKERESERQGDIDDELFAAPKTGRSKPKSKAAGSVTEILNSADIARAGAQKKREQPKTARQSPKMSVTQILNSDELNRNLRQNSSARQMTEEESRQRLARDISRAADERRRRYSIEDIEDKNIGDKQPSVLPIEDEAPAEEDYIKLFVSQNKHEDNHSADDDDIVFHEVGDLVTTDTMQLRKQRKIDDINEALLRIDSEASSPDDMLDSINPMESRERAAEIVKSGESTNEFQIKRESTNTFTVSRLSRDSSGFKHTPAAEEEEPLDGHFTPTDDSGDIPFEGIRSAALSAEIHLGDTIIEALNKKIAEEDTPAPPVKSEQLPQSGAQPQEAEQALNSEQADQLQESPQSQEGQEGQEAAQTERAEQASEALQNGENSELDRVRRADELARKKKLKIANFILESHDTEELPSAEGQEDDYLEEDEEEQIDLDDENVIRDRLNHAAKGLVSRLLILLGLLAVTLFIAIVNALGVDGSLGFITKIVSREGFTDNYMYAHLVIAILSFSACSSVITNGLSRLVKLRPDGDTLCALAHITAIAATVVYIFGNYYVVRGNCHVYLAVSLAALVCNTLSKLFTVKTARQNFGFVFGGRAKYFINRCSKENEVDLAKGVISGTPNIGAVRKTEVLYDFIVSTYSEDASDRLSRKIVPGVIAAGLVGGLAAFFTHTTNDAGAAVSFIDRVCWAATVLSAIFALGASFSSSMTTTIPIYLASRKSKERGSAILGYSAASKLCDLNGILVEARTLFPADSVHITNICGYEKPKTGGEGKVSIDEAIIYAASLAVATDSVMADSFFGMLNRKRELLKEVSGCVYESNLGVMGWIDRQRVLLGNRQHMKSHAITVPKLEKETAANTDNDEVIYLAVGGQVCLLFFVRLDANPAIKKSVQDVCDRGVSLIIKTVDGMITDAEISDRFDIEASKVKILPFEAHETFAESTRFVPRGKAAACCSGSFPSFANAITTSHALRSKAFICNMVQLFGVALGVILAIIFGLFAQFSVFSVLNILLYNTVFAAAAIAAQFIKNK